MLSLVLLIVVKSLNSNFNMSLIDFSRGHTYNNDLSSFNQWSLAFCFLDHLINNSFELCIWKKNLCCFLQHFLNDYWKICQDHLFIIVNEGYYLVQVPFDIIVIDKYSEIC